VVGITNNIVVKPQVTPTEIKAKIEEAHEEMRCWMLVALEWRSTEEP